MIRFGADTVIRMGGEDENADFDIEEVRCSSDAPWWLWEHRMNSAELSCEALVRC
jgi:hypothetical protein